MKFAVVGDPVEHSRSPAIHNAAFEVLDIDAEFGILPIPADSFDEVVETLRSGTLDGVSVTMPHKHSAYEAADELTEAASITHAANTLIAKDGRLFGYNTDVDGVRYALDVVGQPDETPILLLGYGGAAAAALVAVSGRFVSVSGRDMGKAETFVSNLDIDATVIPWGKSVAMATVINATPLGMAGESLPGGVVERAGALIDMAYGVQRTPATMQAAALGLRTADGLTMLVGQAAAAFTLFTGRDAPIGVMDQAARL